MNQRGFANIILIVVIVLLVGAVGYFTFVKKLEPVTQQTPTLAQSLTPTPIPIKTAAPSSVPVSVDSTVNWKTYSYEQFGFSVKYPENWLVSSNGPEDAVFSSIPNSSGVQIHIEPSSLTDSEYQNLNKGCKEIIIGNLPVFSCWPQGTIGAPYYDILKGGYLVTITDFTESQNDTTKLITTFKFTR